MVSGRTVANYIENPQAFDAVPGAGARDMRGVAELRVRPDDRLILGDVDEAADAVDDRGVVARLDEVGRGAVLHADVLPVDVDAKRLRLHTTVWHGEKAVLTGEYLFLHVDQNQGRVTAFPDDDPALARR